MSKLTPILKWAGGKRQLLPQIMPLIPDDYNRYYEPFVGAGAVLLELQPKTAVINDMNSELINVYHVIKDQPEALISLLKKYEKKHNKEFYYTIRSLDQNEESFRSLTDLEKAARTVYLNRTCFNGLYRVNRNGYFNTPMGRNSHIQIVNESGIRGISEYLNTANVTILNTDYRKAMKYMRKTDFVFLDPPYYPTNRDSFIRYDSSQFGIKAQEELKETCDRLNSRGIRFIQTNSNCAEIRELYKDYKQIEVDVRRSINAHADGRRGTELIICNY